MFVLWTDSKMIRFTKGMIRFGRINFFFFMCVVTICVYFSSHVCPDYLAFFFFDNWLFGIEKAKSSLEEEFPTTYLHRRENPFNKKHMLSLKWNPLDWKDHTRFCCHNGKNVITLFLLPQIHLLIQKLYIKETIYRVITHTTWGRKSGKFLRPQVTY